MKKIEKLAKQYKCSEDNLRRDIIRLLLIKAKAVSEDSEGITVSISEGEIQHLLSNRGFKNKAPILSLLK